MTYDSCYNKLAELNNTNGGLNTFQMNSGQAYKFDLGLRDTHTHVREFTGSYYCKTDMTVHIYVCRQASLHINVYNCIIYKNLSYSHKY